MIAPINLKIILNNQKKLKPSTTKHYHTSKKFSKNRAILHINILELE